ncbi:MAG TPA: glutathione S-transferase [Aquabacterium sp.]|nr:glutathione S-transferase [Aquabacterium sp.]
MTAHHAAAPAQPIKLYHFALSGHSHRVQLFLSLLNLPTEIIPVDLRRGEQKTPAFLAMNPFGQVPVIQDGEVTLADSNAILVYLARRYDPSGQWLPGDPVGEAQVQRWLTAAAGLLAFGPSHARVGVLFKRPIEARAYTLAEDLFKVMDAQLAAQRFLASTSAPTIADVALYTYTAHAPEGGIALTPYPHVQRWLADIEALPGFVGMPKSPAASAA